MAQMAGLRWWNWLMCDGEIGCFYSSANRDAPEDACPKLLSWPRCCNGCRNLRYRSCSRRWRCEYSAARAQALADAELRESRIGVDRGEAEFERIMGLIRYDVARGLSPQQIALGRAGQIGASPSTIYRWISRGYAGMCDLDLRRKCGYKPRSRAEPPRATAHGGARSFAAFMGLPEEGRAAACEMVLAWQGSGPTAGAC